MTVARCAFASCQAGGDILERAPRVIHPMDDVEDELYHPGCWAAEVRSWAVELVADDRDVDVPTGQAVPYRLPLGPWTAPSGGPGFIYARAVDAHERPRSG